MKSQSIPREFERLVQDETLQLECRLYGYCPVQAEGTLRGKRFYFRARHDAWTFAVAESESVDPIDVDAAEQGFLREGQYGKPWQEAASWMPYDEAEAIIRHCAEEYVNTQVT